MPNEAMRRKYSAGECIDVREIGEEVEPGVFELRSFTEDKDYADLLKSAWIWSIGRRESDGKIFAAYDTRYYQNPQFACLSLR